MTKKLGLSNQILPSGRSEMDVSLENKKFATEKLMAIMRDRSASKYEAELASLLLFVAELLFLRTQNIDAIGTRLDNEVMK